MEKPLSTLYRIEELLAPMSGALTSSCDAFKFGARAAILNPLLPASTSAHSLGHTQPEFFRASAATKNLTFMIWLCNV